MRSKIPIGSRGTWVALEGARYKKAVQFVRAAPPLPVRAIEAPVGAARVARTTQEVPDVRFEARIDRPELVLGRYGSGQTLGLRGELAYRFALEIGYLSA